MIKEYFFTGKTTEQALEKATLELNISEDEITYEIDQMPVKGFLGIGGNAAKIKVTVDDGIKETSTPKEVVLAPKANEKATKKVSTKKADVKKEVSSDIETDVNNIDLEDLVSHINELLTLMKATNSKVVAKVVENEIHVNITGSDAGLLIGKHGETLDAISYYTNLYLNRKTNSRIRLILDIEDYRLNRKIALEALAKKMANSVVTNNRNVTLEPMQPYERRIIHTALEGFEGITTYSVGNDPYRKIVIAVKKNK